jgi:hypothetical protein
MKNTIKFLSGILLALTILFTSCKKEELIPMTLPDPGQNTGTDSTLNSTKDTVYAPAQDGLSRTFFNSSKQMVFTQDSINKNIDLSDDVIFGYIYNNDALGAELANTYAFSSPPLTTWHQKSTIFRKNVPAATYDNALYKSALLNAWNNATAYTGADEGGYIAPLAAGEIYAFQTEAGKYGLVKIIGIVPGQDPYANYLVFEVKMEK